MDLEPLKMKVTHFFKMSGVPYPVILHHIPVDWNAQLQCCENLKTFIENTLICGLVTRVGE